MDINPGDRASYKRGIVYNEKSRRCVNVWWKTDCLLEFQDAAKEADMTEADFKERMKGN